MFTLSQVAWASFLASAGAGVALIAINERRLGRGNRGLWAVVPALAIVGLVFVDSLPSFLVGVVGTAAMYLTARAMFGADLDEHLRRGGRRCTGGSAVGWALLGVAGTLASIFILAFGYAFIDELV